MLKQCPVRPETPLPSECDGFLRTRIAAGGLQPLMGRKPRDRLLPSHEGRCLHRWKGRWSCVKVLVNTFVNKWNARQVFAKKRRQVLVGGFCNTHKTAVSTDHHCPLVLKLLVKPLEGDGSYSGAGDGARTRDSLLGRQVRTKTQVARFDHA